MGASLVFAVLLLAGDAVRDRGRPDFVMMDSKCVLTGSGFGQKGPFSSDADKNVGLCWRAKEDVSCDYAAQDGSKMLGGRKVAENKFLIVFEESPRIVLRATTADMTVVIDWSSASFILAQTFYDAEKSIIMQKQCTGMIATGDMVDRALSEKPSKK